MKAKYILGMLLVLIAATACVYAADATIDDDYTFTLPDKYTVSEQVEDGIYLQIDEDHIIAIKLYKGTGITDEMISSVISNLESQGYNVTGNQTINYNGTDIVEIAYKNEAGQFYSYTWQVDDDEYAVASYGCPLNETSVGWEKGPVKTIYDSFAET